MKRVLILAATALLAGCTANLGFQVGNTGKSATQPSVGPGGAFSSSAVNARFGEGGNFGAILGVGVLGALFGREQRGAEGRNPPAFDSTRQVNEQDCSKAIENPSANLRCK